MPEVSIAKPFDLDLLLGCLERELRLAAGATPLPAEGVMAYHDDLDGAATGFVCPQCGGALRGHRPGDEVRFACHIGEAFSAAELWIEDCAARNRALKVAARALYQNAALAARLAEWTRARGNETAARRLEQEAVDDRRLREQVRRMLEGRPMPDRTTVDGLEAGCATLLTASRSDPTDARPARCGQPDPGSSAGNGKSHRGGMRRSAPGDQS